MKLIPSEYQESEALYNWVKSAKASCVTVLSPKGGEGNSTLAMSLANKFAVAGYRVLYVDLQGDQSLSNSLNPEMVWRFSDISCQLNTQMLGSLNVLSILHYDGASLKDSDVIEQAFLRLKQEFQLIVIDSTAVLRNNKGNLPLHSLANASELTLLNVAVGYNTDEEVVSALTKIEQAGLKNLHVTLNYQYMPALGPEINAFLQTKLARYQGLKRKLVDFIAKQNWLKTPF
jgi:hypothetical protein